MTAVPGLDLDAFAADLEAVRKDIAADRGASDLRHFRKLTRWSQACTALGWATAWIAPNPLSILALSLGNVSRWTILGHHLCHRGLDGIDGVPPTWHSKRFGRGWRRPLQWLDWMPADSWHEEHDVLHHYKLGEQGDPDVAEENLAWLRGPRVPMWFRYAFVWGAALIWKPTYYAANTINARHSEAEIKRGERTERMNLFDRRAWLPWHPRGRDLWLTSWLPNLLLRFVLPVLLVAALSPGAATALGVNLVLAELLANLHGFLVVVPNHTGADLHRFGEPAGSRAEFLLRQVLGSTNFRTGGDGNDFLHGWLNYQIEHHLWPEMSPLQLSKAQPLVKAVCRNHGVPYVQESVWKRAAAMTRVLVGREAAPILSTRPASAAA
jgi:fatty acid desaturase